MGRPDRPAGSRPCEPFGFDLASVKRAIRRSHDTSSFLGPVRPDRGGMRDAASDKGLASPRGEEHSSPRKPSMPESQASRTGNVT